MHHVTRGYFGLPEIWARNVETFHGGIQIAAEAIPRYWF